ncbi:MAG: calcium-binding protein [Pseudomonadota bacterium]
MTRRGTYDDYFDALGQRESTNNYQLESSLGYLGRYQLGELSLAEIGYYRGDNTQPQDYIGGWTGRDGIKSKQDFLNNPAVQDSAAREYTTWNWDTLTRYGFNIYAGQTLNGHELTLSGILGATWLVGFSGMRDFLQSGGTDISADGYGTSMLEYLALFAGYDTPQNFRTDLEGNNRLEGGVGRDVLTGFAGDDTLIGGGDFDVAVFNGARGAYDIEWLRPGEAIVRGPDGTDRLSGIERARFDDREVDLSTNTPLPPETPPGATNGDDVIRLAGAGERLNARGGDDQVAGGAGNDTLIGANGEDTLRGGPGDDRLRGGHHEDVLNGNAGNDTLFGGLRNDRLSGGDGNDQLNGGRGHDTLLGGDGNDHLSGNADRDVLNGGRGKDILFGGGGRDVFELRHADARDVIEDFKAGDILDFSRVSGIDTFNNLSVVDAGVGRLVVSAGAVSVALDNLAPDFTLTDDDVWV